MAGFVARKITVFSIFFNQRTIALVTLNNVLECCHFFIHLRYIHIFFYFRIDGQSSVQFSEYAKSANLGGVPHPPPPIPPIPTALWPGRGTEVQLCATTKLTPKQCTCTEGLRCLTITNVRQRGCCNE